MAQKRLLIPASLLLLLIGGLFAAYLFTPESRSPLPVDLPEISLEDVQRLMIFAPHCDDEVLGSGGLIQKAIQAGIDVQVVLETNSDGQLFVTMEKFCRCPPRPLGAEQFRAPCRLSHPTPRSGLSTRAIGIFDPPARLSLPEKI